MYDHHDKVLVNADAESRGAAMMLADKTQVRETQAREKLRGDRSADGRGKGPRPAATYRGARKNAARDQH
jgi:hypothetical protein